MTMRILRRPLALVAGLFLAVGLAACGSDSSDSETTSTSESGGNFPVTVEHDRGETTIGKKPERVVLVHEGAIDPAIELGITPVASVEIPDASASVPWLADKMTWKQDANLRVDGKANAESIASYDPDLIVFGNGYAEGNIYDELSTIAPTLVFTWPEDEPVWKHVLPGLAQATGTSNKVADIESDYEKRIATIVDELPGIDKLTMNNVMYYQGKLQFTTPSVALLDLGLTKTADEASKKPGESLSLENINQLTGDIVVVFDPSHGQQELEAKSGFSSIPAAKSGAVVWMDTTMGFALNTSAGPLSLDYVMDHIRPQLEAALAAK